MANGAGHKGPQPVEDRNRRLNAQGIHPSFLIDENLSPDLADLATRRGFPALAATRRRWLRGRSDYVVARYALDNDYILVTNNLVDFRKIYKRHEAHPGIVFLVGASKLRKKVWQLKMMEMALDEVEDEDEEPLQQAIVIGASQGPGRSVTLTSHRYYLPDVAG